MLDVTRDPGQEHLHSPVTPAPFPFVMMSGAQEVEYSRQVIRTAHEGLEARSLG